MLCSTVLERTGNPAYPTRSYSSMRSRQGLVAEGGGTQHTAWRNVRLWMSIQRCVRDRALGGLISRGRCRRILGRTLTPPMSSAGTLSS